MKRMAAGFKHRPRTHDTRTATEHHHAIDGIADSPCRSQDRKELARRPLRAVVGEEPVGELEHGRCDHLGPGGLEPVGKALDGGPGNHAGRERGGGIVADRILGELRADDAHKRLDGRRVWGGGASV